MSKAVGTRIRELREEAGLTQEKLAYESDLGSKGYLSDIEHGLARPTLKTLALLADHLGVLLADLLVVPARGDREQLIDRSRTATSAEVKRLLRALDSKALK